MSLIKSSINAGINYDLGVIKRLVKELGNPEKKLKIIHVSGTNGKGSVCTYMESILIESNCRVGKFSSPIVFDFKEQIRLNGVNISQEDLDFELDILSNICEKLEKENIIPSEFELMTSIAFHYFYRKKVDFVIIETGLGGKNDATNVLKPILSVFTPISLDHLGMIGDNIIEIAEEKSGIIKDKVPVLTCFQDIEVLEVLQNRARELDCDFYSINRNEVKVLNMNREFSEFKYLSETYKISMLGKHQVYNAVLAMKGIMILKEKYDDVTVSNENLKNGLEKAKLDGRFDIISEEPVIVLDGAHNVEASKELRESILTYFDGKRRTAIFAVMKDKDVRGILTEVRDLFDEFIIYEPDEERAMPTFDIVNMLIAVRYRGKVISSKNIEETIAELKSKNEDRVYVAFGSFKHLGLIG